MIRVHEKPSREFQERQRKDTRRENVLHQKELYIKGTWIMIQL